MRARTITSAAVLAAVLVGATACAGGVATNNGTGGGTSGGGTLTVSGNSSEKVGLDAVAAAFEKANKGVTVRVSYAANPIQSTTTELLAGTAPDVLYVFAGSGNTASVQELAANGYLEDLSSQPWASKEPAGADSVIGYKGKLYATAATQIAIGGIYSKTGLSALGLSAPTTFPQVLSFCAAAKAHGKIAYALGIGDSWTDQMIDYSLSASLVYGPDKSFNAQLADKSATFASSGWATAMNEYLQMNKADCFSPDPLGTSYQDSLDQVAQGKALALVQVDSSINGILQENPKASLTFYPLPATSSASATVMPVAYSADYAVNAASKNKALAEKFLDFLMQPAEAALYASKVGSLPYAGSSTDSALSSILTFSSAGKTSSFPDLLWPNAKVQAAHLVGVQNLFAGKATVTQVLDDMQTAYAGGTSS